MGRLGKPHDDVLALSGAPSPAGPRPVVRRRCNMLIAHAACCMVWHEESQRQAKRAQPECQEARYREPEGDVHVACRDTDRRRR